MHKKFIASSMFFGIVLLTGAGCANTEIPSPKTNTLSTIPSQPKTEPVVCSQTGVVSAASSQDLLMHDILLDGQKISTVQTEGPMDVDTAMMFPGIGVLAFQYNGIGGFIPFRSYPFFYAVDLCTKTGHKITAPQGTLGMVHTVSPDGSMVAYADNSGHVGILATGLKSIAYESPSQWSLVNDSNEPLLGDMKFSPDGTKIAFATAAGPEKEHGSIYVLDLKTGTFTKIASNPSVLMHVKGWREDGNGVDYE
ncbi:MAG: hypothetical protein UU48_C0006G0076 [Candidatus Uhrbacteria bacterium GW2011_GWF2_41_16]|uniref:Uncharacterized protein n=1 Tax=Candidatus Uhrbacteria bacterium GW2011_GWF2_41_16 TaxID=1618997 RepID=A0A0G0VEC2_9BACT|nr:MAG: hypothetical protein UU48_C0006G0076 [Candidatus Uhrbacteria bacterium GW2011_GWF2_41_16]